MESKNILIFSNNGCGKCAITKKILDKKGIIYDVIDTDQDIELVKKYDIREIPTMLMDGKLYKGFINIMEKISEL